MALSTWILVVASLAFGVTVRLCWRRKNKNILDLAERLPGPRPLPLFGNALLFTNMGILARITWLMRQYGEYVRVWMGSELQVYIANPSDVRHLLMSNKVNQKGKFYAVLEQALGKGLITGGCTWRFHRKVVTPTYNRIMGPGFCEVFNQEAEHLVRDLERRDRRATFNIFHDVTWATTQCVCRTLMCLTKSQALELKGLKEVIDFTDDMYSLAFDQMIKWYLSVPLFFWALGYKKKLDYFIKTTSELAMDIIRKRRQDLTARNITEGDLQDEKGVVAGYGVVDRFILSEEFTEKEIIEETFTLFTASQESTGKLTSFLLFFLAHNPEWQEKVYNEMIQEIGEDRPLTEEDLKKLVCLDAMFRETLRYMPIAACIQRTVHEDVTLEKSNVTIPAGTAVVFPIHAMHRDPAYWRRPDLVVPDRFLTETNKKKEPEAFLPFSLGAMDCVGRSFAINIVKIMAARVVRTYRLSAEGKIEEKEIDVAISAKFKHGCPVKIQRRIPAA